MYKITVDTNGLQGQEFEKIVTSETGRFSPELLAA